MILIADWFASKLANRLEIHVQTVTREPKEKLRAESGWTRINASPAPNRRFISSFYRIAEEVGCYEFNFTHFLDWLWHWLWIQCLVALASNQQLAVAFLFAPSSGSFAERTAIINVMICIFLKLSFSCISPSISILAGWLAGRLEREHNKLPLKARN